MSLLIKCVQKLKIDLKPIIKRLKNNVIITKINISKAKNGIKKEWHF